LEQRLQVRSVFLRTRNTQHNHRFVTVLLLVLLLMIVLLFLRVLLLVSLVAIRIFQFVTLRRLNLNVSDRFVNLSLSIGMLFAMRRRWWYVLARLGIPIVDNFWLGEVKAIIVLISIVSVAEKLIKFL
jgi:hypothetical protein